MNDLIGSILDAIVRLILWLAGVTNPLAMRVEDGYRVAAVGLGLLAVLVFGVGMTICWLLGLR